MAYPTLASGRTFCTPTTITRQCKTRVNTFQDGTEQRWRVTPQLMRLSVTHANISLTDRQALETFYDSVFGPRDQFSITVDGSTYDHMVLVNPELRFTESNPRRWTTTVDMKQVHA